MVPQRPRFIGNPGQHLGVGYWSRPGQELCTAQENSLFGKVSSQNRIELQMALQCRYTRDQGGNSGIMALTQPEWSQSISDFTECNFVRNYRQQVYVRLACLISSLSKTSVQIEGSKAITE